MWRRFVALATALALLAGCTGEPSANRDRDAAPEPPVEIPVDPPVDGPVDGGAVADAPATDDGQGTDVDGETADGERAPQPEPEPPPIPEGRDALVAQAEALVGAAVAKAATGHLAVLVVDEHGREIVAHAADEPLLPASTLKVVTAAAILTTLGPRYRIATIVESTAPIDGDGVLAGDVLLVGAGDPVLATPEYGRWVYPARPRTPLEELADQLVAAGLTRLEGDVRATAPGFGGPRVPDGWPDRYFSSFDARYSDGLTVDAGLRTILTYPDPDEDVEDIALDTAEEQVDADAATEAVGDPEDLGPPDVRVDHAAEPSLQAAAELIRLLEERDVEVVGGPAEGEADTAVVGRLAVVESPPMLELLRFAMQRSDNQMTDGLFRLAGRARTGDGSFAAGERALRQVLDRYGIDHTLAVFADGSGLSREDRATARLLVELDRAMVASRHGPAWRSIMASMGESGTLERRLRDTVAHGRFIGKTGTLRDVTALSGSIVDAEGARYHLAVMANDEGITRGVARALADELVLLLVADLDGCGLARPGEEDGLVGLPPLVVAC